MKNTLLFLVTLSLFLSACTTQKTAISKQETDVVANMIDTSSVLSNSFSGLMLYDIKAKKTLFQRNENRYFVPASNTKLYTLYASLHLLGDSIPTLKYVESGDSLIFWGMGDATFLNPNFDNQRIATFLKSKTGKNLYFSDGNFTNTARGKGWMWDDYNDDYETELTALPMYGNVVRVEVEKSNVTVEPAIFQKAFFENRWEEDVIRRSEDDNQFFISKKILDAAHFEQEIPLKTSSSLTQQLLMDTLRRTIGLLHIPVRKEAKTLYSVSVDTVYRRMMKISDNLLAEHLLLACGASLTDNLNSTEAIQKITEKYLSDLPDAPKWVDGSGISRYNLFTPRTTIRLLEKLYTDFPEERLFSMMAIGGQVGTLGRVYVAGKPYVFAKSGSMTGVYNQSGYLRTKRGTLILFSFMNNNFNHPVSNVRKEVEKVIKQVYEMY